MPRRLISDAHEWSNEIPTVPTYCFANQQPRERAWDMQRGKKTLLSLTLVKCRSLFVCRSEVGKCVRPLTSVMEVLTRLDGEFGWGGTTAKQ